ncbi:MAG TPA: cytochrome C [Sphingobacteriaceae bacterium]|nr:cytochrome C [Sphingobacteriaceae bacterium]
MKKAVKILVYVVIGLIIVVGALLSYVKFALPNVGEATDLKVEITPQRLERGKYLVNSVTPCFDCHSTRDFSKFSGPVIPNSIGSGGEKFDQNMGLPGEYYAPNITPYHLKDWTDGEILRAITTGVSKDGHPLFPIMPYEHFGKMDQEDIYSIIAYIRTIAPIETQSMASRSYFPMNFIIHTIPHKADLKPMPSPDNQIAYGEYLVNAAACSECHTKREKGDPIPGMEFAGGDEFKFPDYTIISANITPDVETGIGSWTKELFVNKFKTYSDSVYKPVPVAKGEFQTIMPLTRYGNMKTSDIEAIYAYLRTLKPVKNQITRFAAK